MCPLWSIPASIHTQILTIITNIRTNQYYNYLYLHCQSITLVYCMSAWVHEWRHFVLYAQPLQSYTWPHPWSCTHICTWMIIYAHLESSLRLHGACCEENALVISLVRKLETSDIPTRKITWCNQTQYTNNVLLQAMKNIHWLSKSFTLVPT